MIKKKKTKKNKKTRKQRFGQCLEIAQTNRHHCSFVALIYKMTQNMFNSIKE